MATKGSIAGREVFDDLNTEYEDAYRHNPYKRACVQKAISLLKPGSRVLDIGSGTGVPTAQMLADAGLEVTGTDIAPAMIAAARERVPNATFHVADMVEYQPEGTFSAVFIIFSHLQLAYGDFHSAAYRFASALEPGGLMVIGSIPTDAEDIPTDDPSWDETKTYVDGYVMDYWGEPMSHMLLSKQGQLDFLTSMGFEIVFESDDVFQPKAEACAPEKQQYVIARRVGDGVLEQPKPLPRKRG